MKVVTITKQDGWQWSKKSTSNCIFVCFWFLWWIKILNSSYLVLFIFLHYWKRKIVSQREKAKSVWSSSLCLSHTFIYIQKKRAPNIDLICYIIELMGSILILVYWFLKFDYNSFLRLLRMSFDMHK